MRNQEIRKGQHNSFFLSVARASLLRSRNCYVPKNQRPPFLRLFTPPRLPPGPRGLLLQHPFRRLFSRPLHCFAFHSSSSRRSLVNKNKLFHFRHSVAARPRIAPLRSALHGLALARSFVQEIIFLCIGKHARIFLPFPVNPATRPAGYFTLHASRSFSSREYHSPKSRVQAHVRVRLHFSRTLRATGLLPLRSRVLLQDAPACTSAVNKAAPPASRIPFAPRRPPSPQTPHPPHPLQKVPDRNWGKGGLYRPEGLGGSSSFHSSGTPVVHLVQGDAITPNRRAPGKTSCFEPVRQDAYRLSCDDRSIRGECQEPIFFPRPKP